jgi:predicted permease
MSDLPGVTSAAVSGEPAFGSGEGFTLLFTHYRVAGSPSIGQGNETIDQVVGAGYFETLRARLIQGRYFTDTDDASVPLVAIVNRTMASENFPGETAVGKHIVREWDPDHPIEIIGVVDDIKDGPLDLKPTAAVYRAFNQGPTLDFYVLLRTSQSEAATLPTMIKAIRSIDPALIVDEEETMSDRLNNSQSAYLHRSGARVIASFAVLALLLGSVGLYGVISYSVGQRRREIGVRMALGAQRGSVYRLILTEAAWLLTLGVAAGILSSFWLTALLRSILFRVSPWDPVTMLCVLCVLIPSALLASYIPARRAAAINPTEALRAE